jgi:hypothetical protein
MELTDEKNPIFLEPPETGMRYRTTAPAPSGALKPSRPTLRIYAKTLQDVFIFTVYM